MTVIHKIYITVSVRVLTSEVVLVVSSSPASVPDFWPISLTVSSAYAIMGKVCYHDAYIVIHDAYIVIHDG